MNYRSTKSYTRSLALIDLSDQVMRQRRAISLMLNFCCRNFEITTRSRAVSCLKPRCPMEKSSQEFLRLSDLQALHLEPEAAVSRYR